LGVCSLIFSVVAELLLIRLALPQVLQAMARQPLVIELARELRRQRL
jgi:hypothetical protein